jgi:hypothetical protein
MQPGGVYLLGWGGVVFITRPRRRRGAAAVHWECLQHCTRQAVQQGLTLVHVSVQSEQFLSLKH